MNFASVSEIAKSFRNGGPGPVELAQATMQAIAQDEPRLNAVSSLPTAAAMAAAAAAEEKFSRGQDLGPLQGMPIAVKDLFDMAGEVTAFGAASVFSERPPADAVIVARLRAAGGIIVAKSQMMEFALCAPAPSGQTNNPKAPERTAGGSSGGSAALVAAGHVPLAVGTDTGGSIRIPASYCGIVGLKPSHGAIDLDGALTLSVTLDHAGPMASNVADTRSLFAVLSGHQPSGRAPSRPLRLGVISAYRDAPYLADDVRDRFTQACARLEKAGAVVGDVAIANLEDVVAHSMSIMLPEALVANRHRFVRNLDELAEETRKLFAAGHDVSAGSYLEAMQFRRNAQEILGAIFGEYDALISPTVAFVAPDTDVAMGTEIGSDDMAMVALANLTGFPAVSIPLPTGANSLPVGIQLMGNFGSDFAVLDAAESVEAALVDVAG